MAPTNKVKNVKKCPLFIVEEFDVIFVSEKFLKCFKIHSLLISKYVLPENKRNTKFDLDLFYSLDLDVYRSSFRYTPLK